ncbi:MAG: adenine deaminase [Firmicutes bacterium]|nr:adenine deaminase [Bacillota bacterium]
MGQGQKASLVLKDGLVVNVITREVYQADVAIYDDLILKVGDASDLTGPCTEMLDLKGKYYVAPGFIDSHMHFESSMLTISEFSRLSIPSGTTTLVADPHEIANALGLVGIRAMCEEATLVPSRVYLVIPALVPDCPGLETACCNITSKHMAEALGYPNVLGIGELQGFSNARAVHRYAPQVVTDLVASTTYAQSMGKTVDGNAPDLFGSELAAHIVAGGTEVSCHETTRKDECLEKIRYGVYVFMREGSTQKNMAECIRVVTEEGVDSRRLIAATDDMVAEDLASTGHMNWAIRRIIEQGIDPVEAIQMATINPATYFGLKHIGVLSPGKMADIAVISDLSAMEIEKVFIGGRLVAGAGQTLIDIPVYTYPDSTKRSVRREPVEADMLQVRAHSGTARVRTIGLIPDQNLTDLLEFDIPVQGEIAMADLGQDVLPIAVVERYGRTGGIGKGFVKGFGLSSGAFAESVSHDAHNIIVVGTDHRDMAAAVNRVIEMNGGVAVVKGGRVLDELQLPVGGLITDEVDGLRLSQKISALHAIARAELGCRVHAPFMHLSFLSLTTSPKLKITDRGLIDVERFAIVDPVV